MPQLPTVVNFTFQSPFSTRYALVAVSRISQASAWNNAMPPLPYVRHSVCDPRADLRKHGRIVEFSLFLKVIFSCAAVLGCVMVEGSNNRGGERVLKALNIAVVRAGFHPETLSNSFSLFGSCLISILKKIFNSN